MIVGCGEWGFRDLPMEEHFRIVKDFGFRYLEFGIGGGQPGRLPEEVSAADAREFMALGQRYAVETPFCCIENDFTLPTPEAHEVELEKVLGQLRGAARCGATHARLFAGWTPASAIDEAIWSRMLEAFERSDELCAQLGMVISIETHGVLSPQPDGSFVHVHSASTEPDLVRRLVEELPSGVGFNYDVGNLKPFDDGGRTFLHELLDGRINYCHLKDWRRVSDTSWTACAVGDDDLDYQPVLERMRFDGVYLIEYEPLEDTLEGIRRSLDYLASIAPLSLDAPVVAPRTALGQS